MKLKDKLINNNGIMNNDFFIITSIKIKLYNINIPHIYLNYL